ncbi:unnamed protein product [Darwinula stevensoni]|uniref:SCP domain-containing protein n=1 Tax=Darwinula stevensoni TaxID=69355 RepID=A0A7R9AFK8_9CRUS|nr:unnamed protein product [Darwinula stevensoni]CAG0903377.1 unnamed protein product [Darwinula stevensoni]
MLENRASCPSPPYAWGSPATTNCYSSSPSPNCGNVTSFGVSASDKQLIVSVHNSWRARVASGQETKGKPGPQPKASNMRRMVWDNKLAATAQGLANTCNFNHDDPNCRTYGTSFQPVGQNLYMSWGCNGLKPNWTAAVQAWYNEVALFSNSSVSPFKLTMDTGHYTQVVWADTYAVGYCVDQFTMDTGHYTQVVWADTYAVGNGQVAYKGEYQIYACNYGPAGNYIGLTMYGVGAPCSCCKSTCSIGVLCD